MFFHLFVRFKTLGLGLLSSDGILGVDLDQTFYFYHQQPRVPLRLTTMWWQQLWLHTDITSSTGCPNVLPPRRGSDLWADCPLSSWMLRSCLWQSRNKNTTRQTCPFRQAACDYLGFVCASLNSLFAVKIPWMNPTLELFISFETKCNQG